MQHSFRYSYLKDAVVRENLRLVLILRSPYVLQQEKLSISLVTMTVLESQFEQVADAIDAGEVLHFEYDLKFEVVLKEANKTVQGKPLFDNTINVLRQAVRANEVIEFFDVNGAQFHPDKITGSSNMIRDMFCAEMGDPTQRFSCLA
jgi:hypothetical protein